MADELARAKVVVLLSEFETQPLAALEALSLGCRLIVADVLDYAICRAGMGKVRAARESAARGRRINSGTARATAEFRATRTPNVG